MLGALYFTGLLALLVMVTLRGAWPERAIVWIIFIADVADVFYHRLYGPSSFTSVDLVHLIIDGSAFALVLWIALGANRFWPLPVCSLHLIGITGHLAVLSSMPGINQVYWAMVTIPDYLQLPIVAVGTIAHVRRSSRIGRYRDWRRDWKVPAFLSSPPPLRVPA